MTTIEIQTPIISQPAFSQEYMLFHASITSCVTRLDLLAKIKLSLTQLYERNIDRK